RVSGPAAAVSAGKGGPGTAPLDRPRQICSGTLIRRTEVISRAARAVHLNETINMPRYLIPGVYIEEISLQQTPIAGVSTATTAFVGPTATGPAEGPPGLLTSFAEFERVYGGPETLRIAGVEAPNYVAHAARAFFAEGGRRLYVARVTIPGGGRALTAKDYVGEDTTGRTGFAALEACDDVSLIAAPGASADEALGRDVMQALVRHVDRHRHRFAVLDSIRGQSLDALRALRREIESSRAALYHPWVLVDDPRGGGRRRPLALPPSGFICGIYARVDAARGVHKAPANEVIKSARGLETTITARQQDILNPEGINALRSFP